MSTSTETDVLDAVEQANIDMIDGESTIFTLERSVINRLENEVRAEVIDVSVIEALTKTLDIVAYHVNRRDDNLFRASNM